MWAQALLNQVAKVPASVRANSAEPTMNVAFTVLEGGCTTRW
jgi:hypothetical protein